MIHRIAITRHVAESLRRAVKFKAGTLQSFLERMRGMKIGLLHNPYPYHIKQEHAASEDLRRYRGIPTSIKFGRSNFGLVT